MAIPTPKQHDGAPIELPPSTVIMPNALHAMVGQVAAALIINAEALMDAAEFFELGEVAPDKRLAEVTVRLCESLVARMKKSEAFGPRMTIFGSGGAGGSAEVST